MTSSRRLQEQRDDVAASGLRWFELAQNLSAFGSAPAYMTRFNPTSNRWVRDTGSPQRTIYSMVSGVSGSSGDLILCYIHPMTRKWEALQKQSSGGLPKAGGYRLPSNPGYPAGTRDIEWSTWFTISNALFSEDPASPKKKLYVNENGDYWIKCNWSVTTSGPANSTVTLTMRNAGGSVGIQAATQLLQVSPNSDLATISMDGIFRVTAAPEYFYIQAVIAGTDIGCAGFGQFLAMQVQGAE